MTEYRPVPDLEPSQAFSMVQRQGEGGAARRLRLTIPDLESALQDMLMRLVRLWWAASVERLHRAGAFHVQGL